MRRPFRGESERRRLDVSRGLYEANVDVAGRRAPQGQSQRECAVRVARAESGREECPCPVT